MKKIHVIFTIASLIFLMSGVTFSQYGLNLLTNPGAESDFSGWTIVANGGSGWANGGYYTPRTGSKSWSASYLECTLRQTVDLVSAGYTTTALDASPNILAEVYIASYWHPTPDANYRILFELLNESDGLITSWDTGWLILPDNTPWTLVDNTFSGYGSGVRKVRMTLSGHDGNHWGGSYGTGFDDASIRVDGEMPVELTSFKASVSGNNVELKWQTATEINNYGFEIQRKISDVRIELSKFETLSFINGHGNSNSINSYSFIDKPLEGGKYLYRLKQIDTDGAFEYSKTLEVNLEKSLEFELAQNYPNPFNPTTSISYKLPVESEVTLKVYDIIGSEVALLVNETKTAGIHTLMFNAGDLPSGVYIYRLQAAGFSTVKKLTIIK